MYRGQVTNPIRVNARYEMNWADSFFKKFRKPFLETDGWTNRRTDRHRGESRISPFHLRWSGGITKAALIISWRKYAAPGQDWFNNYVHEGWEVDNPLVSLLLTGLPCSNKAIYMYCHWLKQQYRFVKAIVSVLIFLMARIWYTS